METQVEKKVNLPEILYNYFVKENPLREAQDKITFAPSYLNDCQRKIFYKKTGQTPSNPIDSPAYLKMYFGTVMHKEMQKILNEVGVLESFEEPRSIEYEGLTFNYFYDGILNIDGMRHIMEIKTIYGAAFDAIREMPKKEHLFQAISYMVFEQIAQAAILYIGRDNGYMVQHLINAKDKKIFVNGQETTLLREWKDQVDKLNELLLKIESNVLPERDFQIVLKNNKGIVTDSFQHNSQKHKSDWQCSYCSYKDKCWEKEFKQILNHNFYIGGEFL